MSSSVCSRYFKNDFLRFHHQYPEIKVEITENGTEQMFDKLRKNETDLVFTLDRHIYDSDFISEKYVKDGQIKRLDVACCPIEFTKITIFSLKEFTFVRRSPMCSSSSFILLLLARSFPFKDLFFELSSSIRSSER